jgi:hypothetical protein
MSCEGDNHVLPAGHKVYQARRESENIKAQVEFELRSSRYEAAGFWHFCGFPSYRAMLDKMNMKVHASWQGNPQMTATHPDRSARRPKWTGLSTGLTRGR